MERIIAKELNWWNQNLRKDEEIVSLQILKWMYPRDGSHIFYNGYGQKTQIDLMGVTSRLSLKDASKFYFWNGIYSVNPPV